MEKERITDKRKSTKKSIRKTYEEFEKDLAEVKDVVKNPPKKVKKIFVAEVKLCTKCKAEMDLVKTRGLLKIYKCPNCKFTTEEWV